MAETPEERLARLRREVESTTPGPSAPGPHVAPTPRPRPAPALERSIPAPAQADTPPSDLDPGAHATPLVTARATLWSTPRRAPPPRRRGRRVEFAVRTGGASLGQWIAIGLVVIGGYLLDRALPVGLFPGSLVMTVAGVVLLWQHFGTAPARDSTWGAIWAPSARRGSSATSPRSRSRVRRRSCSWPRAAGHRLPAAHPGRRLGLAGLGRWHRACLGPDPAGDGIHPWLARHPGPRGPHPHPGRRPVAAAAHVRRRPRRAQERVTGLPGWEQQVTYRIETRPTLGGRRVGRFILNVVTCWPGAMGSSRSPLEKRSARPRSGPSGMDERRGRRPRRRQGQGRRASGSSRPRSTRMSM